MTRFHRVYVIALFACAAVQVVAQTTTTGSNAFSFIVAGDMRSHVGPLPNGKQQFEGACAAIQQAGPGAFIIIPGDFDPPGPVRASLRRYLGTNSFSYLVVGNHEVGSPENLWWVHQWAAAGIPHRARSGPPGAEATTYSFDFGNSHCVVRSNYFDGQKEANGKDGLSDVTLQWLAEDLAATRQPLIWLASHTPLKSLPDMDSYRRHHEEDSLVPDPKQRARFLDLVRRYHVRALICGHTHNCSVANIDDL